MGHRRLLAAIGFWGMLALAALAPIRPVVAADGVIEFDLADAGAVVEEHTAHLLWNLNTDNIDTLRFPTTTGWNSLYLTVPEDLSGVVTVDLEAGSIAGKITERWQCKNDCAAADGSASWTTTRDTGFTATIVDGTLTPSGPGWSIEATAAISYKATVTSEESPSECAGEVCYICKNRLCLVEETATATATLEGWIEGDTLSLAFEDQLAPDANQMDLSGLLETQFFMSRFSATITGAVIPAAADPLPAGPPPSSSSTTTSTAAVTTENEAERNDESASPAIGDDSETDGDQNPATAQPANPISEGEDSGGRAMDVILILMLLVLGSAAWIRLRRPDWFIPRSKRTPPTPLPVAEGSVAAGPLVVAEVELPEPAITYTLVGSEKWDHRYTEITYPSGAVTRYAAGSRVKVLGRAYDAIKIQVGSDKPVWVDRSYVEMKKVRSTQ